MREDEPNKMRDEEQLQIQERGHERVVQKSPRKGQFKKATCAAERLSIMRTEECNKLLF